MNIKSRNKITQLIINEEKQSNYFNEILKEISNGEKQASEVAKAMVASYDQAQAEKAKVKYVALSIFAIPTIIGISVLLDRYCFNEKFKNTTAFILVISSSIISPLILMGLKSFMSKNTNQEPIPDMRIMEIKCELSDYAKNLSIK